MKHITNKDRNVLSLVCVVAMMLLLTGSYTVSRYNSSGNMDDDSYISAQVRQYFSHFSRSPSDSAEMTVVQKVKRGDYYAVLCRGDENWCYLGLFMRDPLFGNRYSINAGTAGDNGEMASFNLEEKGTAVLAFGGLDLPDDASWYSFTNGGITYTCPVTDHTALNLFVIPDSYQIEGTPTLLNQDREPIGAD